VTGRVRSLETQAQRSRHYAAEAPVEASWRVARDRRKESCLTERDSECESTRERPVARARPCDIVSPGRGEVYKPNAGDAAEIGLFAKSTSAVEHRSRSDAGQQCLGARGPGVPAIGAVRARGPRKRQARVRSSPARLCERLAGRAWFCRIEKERANRLVKKASAQGISTRCRFCRCGLADRGDSYIGVGSRLEVSLPRDFFFRSVPGNVCHWE
jgi:hypothetical protein